MNHSNRFDCVLLYSAKWDNSSARN